MQNKIAIDRFTGTRQILNGCCRPDRLERLKPFQAQEGGEICYTIVGEQSISVASGLTRRLRCTIIGWFWLADPVTLEALHHNIDINSRLVVVKNEAELPQLEMESFEEDYITLPDELDVLELVEEEILLDLPLWAISQSLHKGRTKVGTAAKKLSPQLHSTSNSVQQVTKTSPFAELAKWKK